jgi:predicted PurR-regulated permease PerM
VTGNKALDDYCHACAIQHSDSFPDRHLTIIAPFHEDYHQATIAGASTFEASPVYSLFGGTRPPMANKNNAPFYLTHNLTLLLYALAMGVILYFGRDVFIPISYALLISFVLYPFCSWMEKHKIGRMASILLGVTVLVFLVLSVVALLASQFVDFVHEWPALQSKLNASIKQLSQYIIDSFGVSQAQQEQWLSQAGDQAVSGLMTFIQRTISFSVVSLVMLVLIPVYAVLILYYRELWAEVLYRVFANEEKKEIREILSLTVKTYSNFLKGMGLVYLIVGVLNSIGLLLLGVPHAILFGFIASVLTFIPYVGIMVGSLLPITMAWLTYDSVWYPVGIVGIFAFVQYLEANVIFPFAVSSRLNVNTLVMLIAIFVGAVLWGVSGMILFVPFVGIIKLIAEHNPKLKTLSMALGTGRGKSRRKP